MFTIENDLLRLSVVSKGAEINSLVLKTTGLEYMWGADPDFWAKRSPILFPIVGSLKEDSYFYEGNAYKMGRHGFAREMDFELAEQQQDLLRFRLISGPQTMKQYPFEFSLEVIYQLHQDTLSVTYQVQNQGMNTMYFSIGGHPAFKVPLVEGTRYEDYYLVFDKKEKAGRWPISPEGLIQAKAIPLLQDTNEIPLSKALFQQDALVLKDLSSTQVSLLSRVHEHGLRFDFPEFPYLGIWAAKNADFVCIEPWCGIADSVNSTQQLKEKEGINELSPEETFERTWTVRLF